DYSCQVWDTSSDVLF
nr:immunoglobulin light chain junction region [Macaca mulatta]MOW72464.1 immunoglobulin light chain junction region [Macaca mulatta]